MKRFLALALSLLMLFSLVACSGNTAPQRMRTTPSRPKQLHLKPPTTRNSRRKAPKRSQANRNGLPTTLQFPVPFASGFPSKVSRA